jgi:hypothetical protein
MIPPYRSQHFLGWWGLFLLGLLTLHTLAVGTAVADLQATYLFEDSLSAEEPGAPDLISVDPLGMNHFDDAFVYGQTRRIFQWVGNAFPTDEQAGLSLVTTDLVPSNNYSVEMVFKFFAEPPTWGRVIDVQERQSDNGFYVSPAQHLQVWEDGSLAEGSAIFTADEFHHVVLTDDASSGMVKAYLDGVLQLTGATTVMNINNPDDLMNFFLDNLEGIGTGEFANGQIALLRLYDDVLTDDTVAALAQNPFGD